MHKRIKNDLERSFSSIHSRHSNYGKIMKIIEEFINPEEKKNIPKTHFLLKKTEEINEDTQLFKYKITQLGYMPKENRRKIYELIANFLEKEYIKISRSFSASSLSAKNSINRLNLTYMKKSDLLNWLNLDTKNKNLLDRMRKFLLEHIEEYADLRSLFLKYTKWLIPEKMFSLFFMILSESRKQKQIEAEKCLTRTLDGEAFETFILKYLKNIKKGNQAKLVSKIEEFVESENPLESQQKYELEKNYSINHHPIDSHECPYSGHQCHLKAVKKEDFSIFDFPNSNENIQKVNNFNWNDSIEEYFHEYINDAKKDLINKKRDKIWSTLALFNITRNILRKNLENDSNNFPDLNKPMKNKDIEKFLLSHPLFSNFHQRKYVNNLVKTKINKDKLLQIESHVSEQVMKEYEAAQRMYFLED